MNSKQRKRKTYNDDVELTAEQFRSLKNKLCPVQIGSLKIEPIRHYTKGEIRDSGELTPLNVGDHVCCRLTDGLKIRTISDIAQKNGLPRFKVGTPTDTKQWIGPTRVFGRVAVNIQSGSEHDSKIDPEFRQALLEVFEG